MFNAVVNITPVTSLRQVHIFMLSRSSFRQYSAVRRICFPSHWMLSQITTVETMYRGEKRMNPVTMTIISPRKEYKLSRGSNQRPPVLKSYTTPTELGENAF